MNKGPKREFLRFSFAFLIEECGANPNDQVSTLCRLIIQTLFKQGIDIQRENNNNPNNRKIKSGYETSSALGKKSKNQNAKNMLKYFLNLKNIQLDIRDKYFGKNAATYNLEKRPVKKQKHQEFVNHLALIESTHGMTLQSSTICHLFQKHSPVISKWLMLGAPLIYLYKA